MSSPHTSADRPQGLRLAWLAIRPRTLSLAVTPVLLGSSLAWSEGHAVKIGLLLVALVCALLIQVGTNLHNDAADFVRGTDDAQRIGPARVAASGWVSPRQLVQASLGCFGAALLLGSWLVSQGGWPILLIGLASLAAGWCYSGGPRPVSHTAWGEWFVLVFFGMAAVGGSHWLQSLRTTPQAWLGGLALGLPAAAVLLVNNYRDLEGDERAGRRTWVHRLGRDRARNAYAALLKLPVLPILTLTWQRPGAALALLALPLAWRLIARLGSRQPPGPWLNDQLAGTARYCTVLGLLLAIGVHLRIP